MTAITKTWEQAVQWLSEQSEYQQIVYDCYYDKPQADAANRYSDSEEWKAIRSLLPLPPGRALDLGSGHGITSAALAKMGYQVTAVEPDASDLVGRGAIAKLEVELGLSIDALAGTAEAIPVTDQSFEIAIAREVMHHFRDLPAACRDVFRVLRPGGVFVTIRDHVVSCHADRLAFFEAHPLHRLYGGENAFREDEYAGAIEAAGFIIEKTLRSFDSIINYAPSTRDGLRTTMKRRLDRIPLAAPLFGLITSSDWVFSALLTMLSRIDWRPGRLITFVARKPFGVMGD